WLAAYLVGQPAPEDQCGGGNQQRNADDIARRQHVELLDGLEEVERPELPAVPHATLSQDDDAGDRHIFEVVAEERLAPRVRGGAASRLDVLEDRRLAEGEPDPDGDRDKEKRDDEGQPPAPLVEGLGAKIGPDPNDRGQRHYDAEGGRRLQPAGVVAAFLILDVLGNVGYGSSVLPPETEPLDQAEGEEDEGGGEADGRICGNKTDERRGDSRPAQCDDEGVFAPDLVAEPSEDKSPQWPDQKADREDGHGAQEGRHRVAFLEELDGEDCGQAPEDVEVVPL